MSNEEPRDQTSRQINTGGGAYIEGGVEVSGGDFVGRDKITHVYQSAHPQAIDEVSLAQAQQKLAVLPLDTIPEPAFLPPGSRILFRHNPLFVGREEDLRLLAKALKGGQTTAIGQTAAATGLGGIGKTQLASEFVHRYGQYFAGGVFWLSFADPGTIPSEIIDCGRIGKSLLKLDDNFEEQSPEDQVRLVSAAWQSPLPRLLVFDNCEDEELLDQWGPRTGGCRVLITSRRSQWAATLGVQTLPLGVLKRAESVALLRKHRPDLAADDPILMAIAKELGDLPLALHLAGSFLAYYQAAITPEAYLSQLRDKALLEHASLQGRGTERSPTAHELHVARTFALSYDQLDPTNSTDELALAALGRTACFAPSELIPRHLLVATLAMPEDDPEALLQVEDALRRLADLGLLDTGAEGALLLHRLLAVFVQAVETDTEGRKAVETAILQELYSRIDEAGYLGRLPLLQAHLRVVTDVAQARVDERAATLCNWLGYHLKEIGDYEAARPYYERALEIREAVFGPQHPSTALSLNNLALLLRDQGEYAAAQPYAERALEINEAVFGPQHPDTASSLNNLALLLGDQGEYAAARSYYERALAIREAVRGPQHPDTATSLNNLANLLYAQGEYAAARPYAERALEIRDAVFGPQHPFTAQSLHNLASLLQDQGEYAAAQPYAERALEINEAVFGPQHPGTASSLNNLASLLQDQGDYEAARSYYERALALREAVLGSQHPGTASSLNNLASLLQAQGDYAAARPYYERALEINEAVFGPQHPDTATSLNNLAVLLGDQGDYEAAQPYAERALAIREAVLGSQHPGTASSLNNLALLFQAQGDYEAAQPYYERALEVYEAVRGPQHPDTAQSLNNLAVLFQAQGEYAAARPYYERALAIREAVLGPQHPDTATSLNNLAVLLQDQGEYAAARPYYERALAISEAVFGPQHLDTATSLNNLAILCFYEDNFEDAAVLMRRALAIWKTALGPQHSHTQTARANLAVIEQLLKAQ